ncbi:MAG: NAD-dependent epimerase/dehydratase family protein [Candidatus Altiarchaeota archaeon]
MAEKILITGASGQIGSELAPVLKKKYGQDAVIISDIRKPTYDFGLEFQELDVTDKEAIEQIVSENDITRIYHLASLLSANGEKNPQLAFEVNLIGLYNILEVGRIHKLRQIIWPSSIAAFGMETPKEKTPNETIMRPTTMYGITKVSGELLGNYYFHKYGLDVRGVRFPGIISSEAMPGGGTTDYAVEIFYEAIKHKKYTCYLREDTTLPMMYMPDAINALIKLSEAEISKLKHHCDFNLAAMSFSPKELVFEIKKYIPEFHCEYKPDFRQKIADSWPKSIDDTAAREEWGWKPEYDLERMTKDMIEKISKKLKVKNLKIEKK